MGWFYGLKLHLIVNHQGDLVSVMLTAGNIDDRNLSLLQRLTKHVLGKLFGDGGIFLASFSRRSSSAGCNWSPGLRRIS